MAQLSSKTESIVHDGNVIKLTRATLSFGVQFLGCRYPFVFAQWTTIMGICMRQRSPAMCLSPSHVRAADRDCLSSTAAVYFLARGNKSA